MDGKIELLTQIQADIAYCAFMQSNGQEIPKPSVITEKEYEDSLSKKTTVKEFAESMRRARELTKKPNEEIRAKFEREAREKGYTVI
jgi:hypothetical protein